MKLDKEEHGFVKKILNIVNILVAGMPRSAGTYIFNVIRFIFENNNLPFYSCLSEYYDKDRNEENHIIKIHEYKDEFRLLADKIIITQRDIRDVISSFIKYKPVFFRDRFNGIKIQSEMFIKWNDDWEKYADYIVKYDINNLQKIKDISELLGFDNINYGDIDNKVNELYKQVKNKTIRTGQETEHLFFINQIQDGRTGYYKEILKPDEIDYINITYKDWLTNHNYIIE